MRTCTALFIRSPTSLKWHVAMAMCQRLMIENLHVHFACTQSIRSGNQVWNKKKNNFPKNRTEKTQINLPNCVNDVSQSSVCMLASYALCKLNTVSCPLSLARLAIKNSVIAIKPFYKNMYRLLENTKFSTKYKAKRPPCKPIFCH